MAYKAVIGIILFSCMPLTSGIAWCGSLIMAERKIKFDSVPDLIARQKAAPIAYLVITIAEFIRRQMILVR